MTEVVRALGYTGGVQQLTWGPTSSVQVTAYLWGGAGGGGGYDSPTAGGNGNGGGFAQYSFTLNQGSRMAVAIGQGGSGGVSERSSAAGGSGGRSLAVTLFTSRQASGASPVTNGAWSPFMNTYAVWGSSIGNFYSYSQTVNFPFTGYYTFTYAADNSITLKIDDNTIVLYSGFTAQPPAAVTRLVTAGNHVISWDAVNTGGPRGVALTITQSFSGGNGGAAGSFLVGGGGGGGGGATVLLVDDEIVAIAGGGGGGGGAGSIAQSNTDAPGGMGVLTNITTAGQTGQQKSGSGGFIFGPNGGGGGGGGGGFAGGRGGLVTASLDASARGGSFGTGLSSAVNPQGRNPGNRNSPYYGIGGTVEGGLGAPVGGQSQSGQNGCAVFVFTASSLAVRQGGAWRSVQNVYIRNAGAWQPVERVNLRRGGQWVQLIGVDPPRFGSGSGAYGVLPYDADPGG